MLIDPFGLVFKAYLEGKPSVHFTERDDGYIEETPDASMYFDSYDKWPEYEREAIKEARGRVLDIGLGAGRHSLWIQEQGMDVVGIDLSPIAIEVSKQRGVKECMIMDVQKLDFPDDSFDTVLMLGGNLGLGDVEEFQSVLRKLYRMTTPNGVIIGSTLDPVNTDNPVHLAYHEKNRKLEKPPGMLKLRLGFQGEYGNWFNLLFMGEDLLREIIEPTGWSVTRIYYSGGPFYISILSK